MSKVHRGRVSRNLPHLPLFRWAETRKPVKLRSYAESRLAQRCRLASPNHVALLAELAGLPREGDDDA